MKFESGVTMRGVYDLKKCIFISGVHGVGKNYILNSVAGQLKYRYYDASNLIKQMGYESDKDKKVKNIEGNQLILIEAINRLITDDTYILNGHSIIINSDNNLEKIPLEIFNLLNLKKMVLIVEDYAVIKSRILNRSGYDWSLNFIKKLQDAEIKYMKEISDFFEIELLIFKNSSETGEFINYLNAR